MDGYQFDDIIRSVMGSRRSVLGGSLAAMTGLLGASVATAKKKRKRKKRKPKAKPNAYGCLEVGDPCTSEAQCCSGICDGKKGKHTCRAHDTGTCNQGVKGACETPLDEAVLLKCNNEVDCYCYQTTAGSNFCTAPPRAEQCAACATDADCEALGYPPGSACAPVSQGHCSGTCESGMACLVPCGVKLPEPTSSHHVTARR